MQQEAARSHCGVVALEVPGVCVIDLVSSPVRNDSITVPLDHRDRSAGQVAECVGEIGVVTLFESLPREIAVAVERNLGQQEVAERIRSIFADCIAQFEIAASRLTYACTANKDPAVDPNAPGNLETGGHKHRRPNHGVEARDVLSDDMQIGWPELV